jgi:choline dehydrogenase-like flavoprotein
MMIDARTLPGHEVIETDVCIVGCGPAGLTLALEFANQNFRVCLLESGGLEEPDAEAKSLSRGKTPPGYPAMEVVYNRQFGGTAAIWHIQIGNGEIGARFIPFNETDFDQRSEIPYSGWPITRADMEPFYERAQTICKLGPYNYEPEYWEREDTPQIRFSSDRIKSIICQFTRAATFHQDYREVIQQAQNITNYLHATVAEIETNEAASEVTALRVISEPGKEFRITAKVFILAAGGIEVPRLLLLSNQVQKEGLGNQNDLVGRFFMDHPCYFGGLWFPPSRQLFNQAGLYDLRRVDNTPIMGRFVLTQEVVRREGVMNVFGFLHPRTAGYKSLAVQSLKTLLSSIRSGRMPKDVGKHLGIVLNGVGDITAIALKRLFSPKIDLTPADKGGWSYLPNKDKLFTSFELFLSAEQVPNPNNRIVLIDEKDPLGRQRVQLHWDWKHPIDLHTIRKAQEIFKEEIERAGLGRLEIQRDEGNIPYMTASSAHHLMGTTRMHNDPKQGVVDENCRVHGISNLYIASSSVFPTGGQVNPTLTIVAMAVRLADHIKQVMTA